MRALFLAVLLRDLRLAARRRIDALLPLVFFIVAVSLFPLGVGPGAADAAPHRAGHRLGLRAAGDDAVGAAPLRAATRPTVRSSRLLLAPQPAVADRHRQVRGALAASTAGR